MAHDFNRAILEETAHRPWKMPDAPWLMTQTWHDLLFAHWRVSPEWVRASVPTHFPIDLFDGDAWIGIVPFHMTSVSARGVPALPWVSAFPELNVRTYVRVGDRPGVYFFSLDAGNPLAVRVARMVLNLPYYSAAMAVTRHGDAVEYRSRRQGDLDAAFEATYRPDGSVSTPVEGTLEYFLTERYCLYHVDRRGRPYRLEIHHPPWPLQPAHARLLLNTMASASGLSLPNEVSVLHFARRQDMVAWAPCGLG
jgi:uncharacterized protein YqjF (DUF2071 family)